MKQYEVTAPYLVFGIPDGTNGTKQYALKQGDTVELPESNNAVMAMLDRKQIREVPSKKVKK